MNADLQTALLLLLIGMITVFVILFLVVLTGKSLILIINKYFAAEEKISYDYKIPFVEEDHISKKKLAAITATVEIMTNGQGKITKIERQ